MTAQHVGLCKVSRRLLVAVAVDVSTEIVEPCLTGFVGPMHVHCSECRFCFVATAFVTAGPSRSFERSKCCCGTLTKDTREREKKILKHIGVIRSITISQKSEPTKRWQVVVDDLTVLGSVPIHGITPIYSRHTPSTFDQKPHKFNTPR